MPFERYLRADDEQQPTQHYYRDYTDDGRYTLDGHHGIQFQIPQFMYNGPPILAPGGGAEVLPAGLLDNSGSFASSWFANNGFAPSVHLTFLSLSSSSSHFIVLTLLLIPEIGKNPLLRPQFSPSVPMIPMPSLLQYRITRLNTLPTQTLHLLLPHPHPSRLRQSQLQIFSKSTP